MKKLIISFCFAVISCSIIGQNLEFQNLVHDGITREYAIYVPENLDYNSPIPLMFNFHGGGGDIESQLFVSDMRSLAEEAGFIVVYPQALPDPNDDGNALWTHKEPTTVDDIFFVEAMIDKIGAEYNIDTKRVYACGYSNGGEFTFELACRSSNRIAAIGVVARSMFIETFNNCTPSHPTAVVTIHGTNDDYEGISWLGELFYVSLDNANEYWVSYNNANSVPTIEAVPNTSTTDGSTVEHYSWDDGDGCVSVSHLKVINGGHDWPGTFGNMDIDASKEIWDFVSQFDLEGRINCSTSTFNPNTADDIVAYPNPASDLLNLSKENNKEITFRIYNSKGEAVIQGATSNRLTSIDISGFDNGIYILQTGDKSIKFSKID